MAWSKAKFGSVERCKIKLLEELNKLDVILESYTLSPDETTLKLSSLNELDRIKTLKRSCGDKELVFIGSNKETTIQNVSTVLPTQGIVSTSSTLSSTKRKLSLLILISLNQLLFSNLRCSSPLFGAC